VIDYIAMILLASFAFLILIRIFLGPTIWDRLLGLNLLSPKIIMLIVLYSLMTDRTYLLDVAIVFALLSFVSIIFIARFVQGKGNIL